MSCIDSAIIKALVEHIGMNPDDIPTTGGAGSGTSTGEVLDIPVEYNPFRIKKEDMPENALSVGSVICLKFTNGAQLSFLLTSILYKSGSSSTIAAYHFTCYDWKGELRLQESGTHSGYYVFSLLGSTLLDNMVQNEHQIINFTLDSDDTRPLPAYYTLLLMRSLYTMITEVHEFRNNNSA